MPAPTQWRVTITHNFGAPVGFSVSGCTNCTCTGGGILLVNSTSITSGVATVLGPWNPPVSTWTQFITSGGRAASAGQPITWSALWEWNDGSAWHKYVDFHKTENMSSTNVTSISCAPRDPSTVPPAPCVPHLKPGQDAQVFVTDALIAAVTGFLGKGWLSSLFWSLFGQTINLQFLCTAPPPNEPQPQGYMWANPGIWAGRYLYQAAWYYFCECTPAIPDPVPPTPPVWTDPPDRPADPVYPINPTNPCLDLTEVRRKLDRIIDLVGEDLQLDQVLQATLLPVSTRAGATHTGLRGGGTFAVDSILGILITWTDGEPAAVWEGEPPYFKDLGWVSASDGGAMLIESRVTRQQQTWIPRGMSMANVIGYYAKPGITLSIQELYADLPFQLGA